jgi:hypothetical protein
MSKIPFSFDITPSYFRKNGWFKCDNTFKFVSWCFSRCSSIEKTILHDNQTHKLKPFQFIFGRYKCSEETNMSEREVRTQQKLMENSGLLKKSPNKTPNRFTIYEWVTDRFSESNDQVKDQQTTNRRPTDDHNLDDINTDLDLIDQIDLGNSKDDSEVLVFDLKKGGTIRSTISQVTEILKNDGWKEKEIVLAIIKMKAYNPSLNGKIESYLTTILKNQQNDNNKKCNISKTKTEKLELPKDKDCYSVNDTSEAPLAKFVQRNGLKRKSADF